MIKRIIAYIISAIMALATGIYDRFDEKTEIEEQYEKLWTAVDVGNEQKL